MTGDPTVFRLPRRLRLRVPHPTAFVELPTGGVVQVPASLAGEVRAAAARQLKAAEPVDLALPAHPGVDPAALASLDRLERQVARLAARVVWPTLEVYHGTGARYWWRVNGPRGEILDENLEGSHAAALQRGLEALAGATVRAALERGAVLPAELAAPV